MLFKTTQSHDLNLSKSSVSGILSLSILPLLLAFFLPLAYVLSDVFFINQIDKELASQILPYAPYCLILTLFSLFIAPGASSFVTKGIAQFDYDSAENMAGSAVIWTFLFGCLIAAFAFFGLNYAIESKLVTIQSTDINHIYPFIITIPFLLLAQTYFELLKAQGKTVLISVIAFSSIALHIALNYVANTQLDFHILGISAASAISIIVTSFVLMIVFATGQTEIRLKPSHLTPSVTHLFSIINQSFIYFSIVAALVSCVLGVYFWLDSTQSFNTLNNHHIFLISCAICFGLFSPCVALLLSYQTLSVFNLSTFDYARVKSAHKFSIRFIAIYGLIITAAIQFFPNEILDILYIEENIQLPVLKLCLFLSLGFTLYFINASWSTFLQTQDSIKSATIIIWLPALILIAAYYAYPQFEAIIDIKQNPDIIWYTFVVACLITSIFSWVRFAFAFNEINKVKKEKVEKVKKLAVKTQPKPVVEKIIIPAQPEHTDVQSDFDDDFLSSFATDSEEQLEELDDIDEFEKAMQSYNQNMDSNKPSIELKSEQPSPDTEITESAKNEHEPQPDNAQSFATLDDLPESEDEFGSELFLDEVSLNESTEKTPELESSTEENIPDLSFELTDEFSTALNDSTNNDSNINDSTINNSTENDSINETPQDDQLVELDSLALDESDFDLLESTPEPDEDLQTDTLEFSIDELEKTEPVKTDSESAALLDEAPSIDTFEFSIDELELTDSTASSEIETTLSIDTLEIDDDLNIEASPLSVDQKQKADLTELSIDDLEIIDPIETLEVIPEENIGSNKTLSTDEPSSTLDHPTIVDTPVERIEPENSNEDLQLDSIDDLSLELEKIDLEFNELYQTNGETDFSNLDALINAADIHSSDEDDTSELSTKQPSNETNDSTLFTAEGDEEIIEIFFEEAEEIFEVLPGKLASFKSNNQNKAIIKELQRDFHTLKGGSRMASIEPMGDLCHQYEILFERLGNGSKHADETIYQLIDDGLIEIEQAIKKINDTKQCHFNPLLVQKIKEL